MNQPEASSTDAASKPPQPKFGELNRAQRRRVAKKAGLFKGKTRDSWRSANKSMVVGGKKRHEHNH